MFEAITDPDERGQVGIGTLIIFIALVLVAAVAAGVLVKTSGMLQSKASDTADDTQAQVTNHFKVVSATGLVNTTTHDGVDSVNLTVMKASGSSELSINDASFKYVSTDTSATVTNSSTAVQTSLVASGSTSDKSVLDESEDRLAIQFDLTHSDLEGEPLKEGEEATLRLIDQSGGQTIYGINVPDTITNKQTVTQV